VGGAEIISIKSMGEVEAWLLEQIDKERRNGNEYIVKLSTYNKRNNLSRSMFQMDTCNNDCVNPKIHAGE